MWCNVLKMGNLQELWPNVFFWETLTVNILCTHLEGKDSI